MATVEGNVDDPLEDDDWYTVDQYQEAILRLADRISPLQRQMLVAHAEAPECMLSVRQLAAAGGCKNSSVTYSQYGRLGHLIADSLGIDVQWKVWTNIIGAGFRTDDGELIWEMHSELVEALVSIGWASHSNIRNPLKDISPSVCETDTEYDAIVQARLGQGPFRLALLRYWGACAVTGVSEPAALRASHIKPWHASTNEERLDPNNGLLLAAHLDALFDAGLITFESDGKIRLSRLLAEEDRKRLGITSAMQLRRVTAAHERYLTHHRNFVFRIGLVCDA